MTTKQVLALDLGASSGRAIIGSFDGCKLSLEEISRFPNGPKRLGNKYYWDFILLMDNIYAAIARAGMDVASLGVDTWGVDFGLLDRNGNLLSNPRSYRDPAFDEKNLQNTIDFFGGETALFEQTYVASLRYTVLSKLYWMLQNEPGLLDQADHLLMLPNLIEYYLTGEIHSEYTIASTSQLYDMKHRCWNETLINRLGINRSLFSQADISGRILGKLNSIFWGEQNSNIQVISVAGHDTACAAAAVPSKARNYTFLSSGTWSLMGTITDDLLSDSCAIRNKIGNEGAANGAYRPTVNITGLWIIQECKRCWEAEGKRLSYDSIAQAAAACQPLRCFIDPNLFQSPGPYPSMIRHYCQQTGQYVPQTEAEIARCVFDSLALQYKKAYDSLCTTQKDTDSLYIIGGGINNRLLNQLTANAIGVSVMTGPSESTAIGNIIQQLQALGEIDGEDQAKEVIRSSFASEFYLPKEVPQWEDAYIKFCNIIENYDQYREE